MSGVKFGKDNNASPDDAKIFLVSFENGCGSGFYLGESGAHHRFVARRFRAFLVPENSSISFRVKALPLVACSLLAVAGVLLVRGKDDKPSASPGAPARIRERAPRGTNVRDLIATSGRLGKDERKSWVSSLSDADLQRLTRAIIADYLAANPNPDGRTNSDFIRYLVGGKSPEEELRDSMIPLLTLLAMESGRRDADAFLVDVTKICGGDASGNADFILSLRCAAAVGLAEVDAPRAWTFFAEAGDFISYHHANLPPATEAIFRKWAKTDPETAWKNVTNIPPVFLAPAVRGQLAETTDPVLRATILDWVGAKVRATESPAAPGDQTINRNSIDAILNNPNRLDHSRTRTFAALGLAEQDPEAAWAWIRSNTPAGDDSLLAPFLWQWARRRPEDALGFWKQHAESLGLNHHSALASGLSLRDPIAALEVFSEPTHFSNDDVRYVNFVGWVSSLSAIFPSQDWPLLSEAGEAVTPAESLTIISQNLHMLKLPPGSEAQAHHLIEQQLERLLTR